MTSEGGQSGSQLLWIVASLALADELLPSLKDVSSSEQREEGWSVGDVKRRTFLQSYTCDHLQGVVGPGTIHVNKKNVKEQKMLEGRPKDTLVKLVKSAFTAHNACNAPTARTANW